MKFPTINQLKKWGIESTVSLTAAAIFSGGIISPLTIALSGTLFALQVAANYPVASFVGWAKRGAQNFYNEHIDGDYEPDSDDDEMDELLDQEYEEEFGIAPILEGVRAQLFETSFSTYEKPTLWRRISGINWMFGEKTISHQLPKLDTAEIANMPYGSTRSGIRFKAD